MTTIRWKKISNYCIEHEEIYISRYKLPDSERFAMWHNTKLIQIFNSAKEAKDAAVSFIATKSTSSN
jgi:hypothetical protein